MLRHNCLASVAILTWNRQNEVLRAIRSVKEQSYGPLEIVVVDSASTDSTVEIIGKQFPDVKVVRLHRNMGCPEGRNLAMANCSGEIIFCLDDDGWLEPDAVQICVDSLHERPDVGVVACRIVETGRTPRNEMEDCDVLGFSGGACAIRKAVLEDVGYYPSDFVRQAEEHDLAIRLVNNGYRIRYCHSAVMHHQPSAVNRDKRLFAYYACRNEMHTIFRLYPLLYVVPSIAYKIISWVRFGLRNKAFHYVLAAVLFAILKAPSLMFKREPVSYDTIRLFLNRT